MSSGWSGIVAPPATLPRGRGVPDHLFEMRRTLRFSDARVERSFQEQYFRDNVGYVRTALLFAIGVWAFFGLLPLLTRGSNVVADEGMAWHLVVTLGAGAGVASRR